MEFLINLYSEELHRDYMELSSAMDEELCTHLLARTGNDDLRQIFKARLEQIAAEQSHEHYGLIDSPRKAQDEYPTYYGDKIELISAAAKVLKTVSSMALDQPPNGETIKMIALGADLLFQAGLPGDCLALLNSLLTTQDLRKPALK